MALEAVVYPQDPLSYGYKDCNYSLGNGGRWGYDFPFPFHEDDKAFLGILENNSNSNSSNIIIEQQAAAATGLPANWESSSSPFMQHAKDHHHHHHQWDPNNSSPETCTVDQSLPAGLYHPVLEPPATSTGRRKRRRTKSTKNKEEIENQRMTHIAVERNRRKQMNEYLAVLRSLMPASYVQRGDQASIIGGAINFVKELEQLLQTMEVRKKIKQQQQPDAAGGFTSPFADFFSFPQYSTRNPASGEERTAEQSQNQWTMADIEVTMVESHANLKILSKTRPRELLKMVAGLQGLRLSVLHLNVTTVDQMVLYSVSVKVEEGCHLNTVDEIAGAVNQLLHRIHEEEESAFS